jgi:hypothetical protein
LELHVSGPTDPPTGVRRYRFPRNLGTIEGEDRVTLSEFTAARPMPAVRRPNPILMGQLAVFAIGATSGLHIMQYAVTGLSLVCLLLVPAYLLMTHRAADVLPVLLGVVGCLACLAAIFLSMKMGA